MVFLPELLCLPTSEEGSLSFSSHCNGWFMLVPELLSGERRIQCTETGHDTNETVLERNYNLNKQIRKTISNILKRYFDIFENTYPSDFTHLLTSLRLRFLVLSEISQQSLDALQFKGYR